MVRKGFSDNVLPATPLNLRRPPHKIVIDTRIIKGTVDIQRVLDQGRQRRQSRRGFVW